jgi:antitoxin FitA
LVSTEQDVATTLTLKNIPDDLYARLKQVAELHHRSLNSEVIVCLESVLQPQKTTAPERLRRIRNLRASLPQKGFRPRDIAAAVKQGRP